ncbi:hypothetical protein [Nocardioides zhouii]|uniref:Uncharacterized protein n=1 Tax=Nocardioides zhouii TaxID=1168729 RepID=A0A4Q2SE48_9ACTN|nr:hypothetical protein [Nocardioides zhouii]RYC03332.1 hypothetical protein EUA94_21790 [Nocardioides zhouii]
MPDPHAILRLGTLAAREARQVQQRWFADITDGDKTFYDLVEAACAADGSGRPLHNLKIHLVLAAQPHCSAHKARAILRKIVALLDRPVDTDLDALTIAWLIDSRSHGRRIAAYLDVTTPLQVPEGFPWSRVPDPVAATFPAPTPIGYPAARPPSPAPVTTTTYPDPWADDD